VLAWRGGCADVLTDSFGRVASDLRVSLTDRCNLRCTYCMPARAWTAAARRAAHRCGTHPADDHRGHPAGHHEIRFTGGEPLLRRSLPALIARAAQLRPRPEISLTTNGIGLARLAGPLREAGLDRLNVSLDTVSAGTFRQLTRRDRLSDVLAGLAAAALAGLAPVKVNAVLMRGVNDDEAPRLLAYCLDHDYQLRFIEQMPLDAQHGWQRSQMVTADEILRSLSRQFALTPDDPAARGAAPARSSWSTAARPGSA